MDVNITLENEQDAVEISDEINNIIKSVVSKTLECEGFDKACMVSVTIVDNNQIHQLNNEFRSINRPTDVLSFPVVEFENGNMIQNCGDYYEGKLILGDVVLSAQKAKEQSIEYGHSLEREIGFLVCHSVLHLLGYDHETEDERIIMRQKEEAALELLGLTR